MSDLESKLAKIRFIVSDVDGVLTDGRIGIDDEGRPFRSFHVRDGTGLGLWKLAGGKSALVSGQGSKALETIAAQWECDELMMEIRDKGAACRGLAERHGMSMDELAFIGDDLLDLSALSVVGLSVAVSDAVAEVRDAADFVTELRGGGGALRELIEILLRAQGNYEKACIAYHAENSPMEK